MADAREVARAAARRPASASRRWCQIDVGSMPPSSAGSNHVAVFAAASETFSQRNINQSIADSMRN
jgi:hydroxymethylglutaryl-CoA lyase